MCTPVSSTLSAFSGVKGTRLLHWKQASERHGPQKSSVANRFGSCNARIVSKSFVLQGTNMLSSDFLSGSLPIFRSGSLLAKNFLLSNALLILPSGAILTHRSARLFSLTTALICCCGWSAVVGDKSCQIEATPHCDCLSSLCWNSCIQIDGHSYIASLRLMIKQERERETPMWYGRPRGCVLKWRYTQCSSSLNFPYKHMITGSQWFADLSALNSPSPYLGLY